MASQRKAFFSDKSKAVFNNNRTNYSKNNPINRKAA